MPRRLLPFLIACAVVAAAPDASDGAASPSPDPDPSSLWDAYPLDPARADRGGPAGAAKKAAPAPKVRPRAAGDARPGRAREGGPAATTARPTPGGAPANDEAAAPTDAGSRGATITVAAALVAALMILAAFLVPVVRRRAAAPASAALTADARARGARVPSRRESTGARAAQRAVVSSPDAAGQATASVGERASARATSSVAAPAKPPSVAPTVREPVRSPVAPAAAGRGEVVAEEALFKIRTATEQALSSIESDATDALAGIRKRADEALASIADEATVPPARPRTADTAPSAAPGGTDVAAPRVEVLADRIDAWVGTAVDRRPDVAATPAPAPSEEDAGEPDAGWETCAIGLSHYSNKFQFDARAKTPEGDEYSIARSPLLRLRGGEPQQDDATLGVYEDLVARVIHTGWEPAGNGGSWYARRFRRPRSRSASEQD